MQIKIQLTNEPIAENVPPSISGTAGAWAEFRGIVRGEENGASISALEYEAYVGMAEREMRRLLEEISARHPCLAATVIHRIGIVSVGDVAIYVGVAAKHRGPAFALLAEFMDRLKKDVPIWKRRGLPTLAETASLRQIEKTKTADSQMRLQRILSLDEALSEIDSRCQTLPGVHISLNETLGRVLRETVCATEDSPSCDRSTRDGYAFLEDDTSEIFSVEDTLHAADWKPRQLKNGEAIRVATGSSLPCENLRVVMQEDVERTGDTIKIIRPEKNLNVRRQGEEMRAGDVVLSGGNKLGAGALALLASAGCAHPMVSRQLRVVHFTTGDEIIPVEQLPKSGQVRDSNSIMIRALLAKFGCEVKHAHLPEDFVMAKSECEKQRADIDGANVILVSGGASVGEKDFTRPLLEWLGFDIAFSQVNIRPGKPLIFGVSGNRIAFGLPGNPLSHFVCFHLFVAAALEKLTGGSPQTFLCGTLADKLEDTPNPRETLWPARLAIQNSRCELTPLRWNSSGDVTVLAQANALIRVAANSSGLAAGAEVEFLPVNG